MRSDNIFIGEMKGTESTNPQMIRFPSITKLQYIGHQNNNSSSSSLMRMTTGFRKSSQKHFRCTKP